ncbi:hypothetical protein AGDE_04294 [Angomonas deanei]|nr:hypothetical protein AGDE_12199 [Angomonas deanei]EPY39634.1 hypothetical protein AGDE_04294 [Angomonas deanei]|eukprot:EPY24732.1 hypothetical protein AGDE_12199 [Angomonas deanei]
MSLLSADLFHLRASLLREAAKHVKDVGFTSQALLKAMNNVQHDKQISANSISAMFTRGFEAELVDFVVKDTTLKTQQHLDKKYSKNAIIDRIAENEQQFLQNRFFTPKSKDIVVDAMTKKLELMAPFKHRWHEAVEIEYRMANVPYTLISLAEFVDTVTYYADRMDSLNLLLAPAKQILVSKSISSFIPTSDADEGNKTSKSPAIQFLEKFVEGVSLSTGPHDGAGLSMTWYARRAKLGAIYGTCVTSYIGDSSVNAQETKQLVHQMADCMF